MELVRFLPWILVAGIAGLLAGDVLARTLRIGTWHGRALGASIGLILAITLAPTGSAWLPGTGLCDLTRVGPPSIQELTTLSEPLLNILLFVPLGVCLGAIPRNRRSILALAGAIALPIAIETIQALAPPLGRFCDSADLVDNLVGLAVGVAIGTILSRWRIRESRD